MIGGWSKWEEKQACPHQLWFLPVRLFWCHFPNDWLPLCVRPLLASWKTAGGKIKNEQMEDSNYEDTAMMCLTVRSCTDQSLLRGVRVWIVVSGGNQTSHEAETLIESWQVHKKSNITHMKWTRFKVQTRISVWCHLTVFHLHAGPHVSVESLHDSLHSCGFWEIIWQVTETLKC